MQKRLVIFCIILSYKVIAEPPPSRSSAVEELRREAQALLLVQGVLSWYTRTVGEPSIGAETYVGHERLFSKESIATVDAALRKLSPSPDCEECRALKFLKSHLAVEYLGQHTAHFDDEAENAELTATVKLPWLAAPVPYKQSEILANEENDAGRRAVIESARAQVWKTTLNPILERKEAEVQRLARELGYRSYVELSEESRLVELAPLVEEGKRVLESTESVYDKLLAEVAQKELHLSVEKMRRADLGRLRKAPRFEKFLPKELLLPAFAYFLSGIGLDMKTVNGAAILIDDAPHPLKEPRAACYNLRVPDDIRITVKPTGGVDDFATFFHEGGHALHFANTRTRVWEFQQLGSYAGTEAFGELFAYSWDDPVWLRRYRQLVEQYNKEHHTAIPRMSDADIRELSRLRVFNGLFFVRRYAAAKLPYEIALHTGQKDLQDLYRRLFERAYGFPLTPEDALRFRTDVDDTFYSADYTRAFALANLMHEALREKYGEDWYGKKEVGAFLKPLFAEGQRLLPDEVARAFGKERVDFRPTEARAKRLLQ
jgi:hypothetical protein